MEGYPEQSLIEGSSYAASVQEALGFLEEAASGESRMSVAPTVVSELQQAAQDFIGFDKSPTVEGGLLRDKLVLALFSEGTIEDVLPVDTLHSATKLLIGAHLKHELEIGLRVHEFSDLMERNPQALPARMVPALSARDRLALEGDDLLSVQEKRVLFRLLMGFSVTSITESEALVGRLCRWLKPEPVPHSWAWGIRGKICWRKASPSSQEILFFTIWSATFPRLTRNAASCLT